MSFASKNEENQFKKWLKDSPFNSISKDLFGDSFMPNTDQLIALFRQEREQTKKKHFLPFGTVYKDTFLKHLPKELSAEQTEHIQALTWRFIVGKIDAMNKILEKSYDLMDKGQTQEGLQLTLDLANAGHPEACYLYATYLLRGQSGSQDAVNARIYAEKALEFVEHPRACLVLAGMYHEGITVEQNRRTAVNYIRNAERHAKSDPTIYSLLAEYYQDGYIVGRDVEKAAIFAHMAK